MGDGVVWGRGHGQPWGVAWQGRVVAKMSAWWMPWRWRPRKDAATRRNAPGRRWQPVIRGYPNGATCPGASPGAGHSREGVAGGNRGN